MPGFDLEILIRATPSRVYQHLARPENFIGLQPLLTVISPVSELQRAGQTVRAFETVETFRLGGWPIYHNRIQVEFTLTQADEQLDAQVKSFPNVRLHSCYRLQPESEVTRLQQHVEIQSPWFARGFVMAEAQRVQRITLANLKARLE
jgi:hypothetical protein